MTTPVPAGSLWPVALIALGVLGLVAYVYATKPKRQAEDDARAAARKRQKAIDDCNDLEHQIAESRLQGLDQVNSLDLEARFRSCLSTNGLDVSRAPLVTAKAMREQVSQEFSHLKATDYADQTQRENTFNTLVRVESDFTRQMQAALDAATTRAGVDAIVEVARGMEADSRSRFACFKASAGGCDRIVGAAFESRSGDQKSTEEWENCLGPIIGLAQSNAEGMDSPLGQARRWPSFYDLAAAKRASLPPDAGGSRFASSALRTALSITGGLRPQLLSLKVGP